MKSLISTSPSRVAMLGLAVLALSAATGLAFAAWAKNGAAIFLTFAQSGLSWCF